MTMKVEVEPRCKPCEMYACLSVELELSKEETKKLAKLEMNQDPDKIISFLESIRDDDRLKKALSKCNFG